MQVNITNALTICKVLNHVFSILATKTCQTKNSKENKITPMDVISSIVAIFSSSEKKNWRKKCDEKAKQPVAEIKIPFFRFILLESTVKAIAAKNKLNLKIPKGKRNNPVSKKSDVA